MAQLASKIVLCPLHFIFLCVSFVLSKRPQKVGSFISNFGQMKGTMMRTFIVLAVVLGFNAFFLQTAKVTEAAKIQNPANLNIHASKDANNDGVPDAMEAEQDSDVSDIIYPEKIQDGEWENAEAELEYAA